MNRLSYIHRWLAAVGKLSESCSILHTVKTYHSNFIEFLHHISSKLEVLAIVQSEVQGWGGQSKYVRYKILSPTNAMTKTLCKVAKLNGGRAPSSPLSTSSSPASGSPQSSSPPQTPFTLLSLISRCSISPISGWKQTAFGHTSYLQPRPCYDDHCPLPELAGRRLLLLWTLTTFR